MRYIILIFVFFVSSCQFNTQDYNLNSLNNKTQNKQNIYTDNSNLWHYIANKSNLKYPEDDRINNEINWFLRNPDYLERVSKRAQPYLYLVVEEMEKAAIPIELALLPIVESAYYPFAFSHGAAEGLWQFIPTTGNLYGLEEDWWYSPRRDVLQSTRAAIQYLKNLHTIFKGDWLLAIASYNAGPGRVLNSIQNNKAQGKKTDFWNLDLPHETIQYVPRLLAISKILKEPLKYKQKFTKVENKAYLKELELYEQFDLALISQWTKINIKDIYNFNSGLKRWATPEYTPFTILMPIEDVANFEKKLQENINFNKVNWIRHKIKTGENINYIAKNYNTTKEHIIIANELQSDVIFAGQYLIVPAALEDKSYYLLSHEQREMNRLNAQKETKKIIYKVAVGDSLWSIAQKFNVNIRDIVKWNHLSPQEILNIDKELIIWFFGKDKDEIAKIMQQEVYVNRNINYEVKSGDSLYQIAKKYNVNVDDIIKWNNIKNSNFIKIGQELNITINVLNFQI